MIDIEELKPLIVERLKSLDPNRIILFGSYAYGMPNADSDIDLFIEKHIDRKAISSLQVQAGVKLFDLIKKYRVGFDIFVDSKERVEYRIKEVKDQFYDEILKKGIVIYGK